MDIRLHHLGMAVGDVEATIEALAEALGAERLPAPSVGHVLVRLGGVSVALVPRQDADPKARPWGDHLALTLSETSREQAVEKLMARGWQSQAVRGRTYVRSPDGLVTLELLVE